LAPAAIHALIMSISAFVGVLPYLRGGICLPPPVIVNTSRLLSGMPGTTKLRDFISEAIDETSMPFFVSRPPWHSRQYFSRNGLTSFVKLGASAAFARAEPRTRTTAAGSKYFIEERTFQKVAERVGRLEVGRLAGREVSGSRS